MYMRFFGLKQEPFSLAPDPRYLYMSKRHREALAHLLYGVGGGGGFVLLSGEIGAGKTTVCRCFLEQIPKRCNVAYIFNPKLTVLELVKSVCDEFRIPVTGELGQPMTVKTYVDALNAFLLQTHAVGQNNVLIIDEAQMLSVDVLEQLRLLTNLETSERKLLQIVLIGQPELRTMLERPELEQLAQRVIARFHLKALSSKETEHYIRHRLSVAGMTRAIPFDRKALQLIHDIARGVPRRINLLCDRSMLGAYAHGKTGIDSAMVEKSAREVFGKSESSGPDRSRFGSGAGLGLFVATGLALTALLAFAVYGAYRKFATPAPVVVAASAPRAGASSASAAATAASIPAKPASTASATAASSAIATKPAALPASGTAALAPAPPPAAASSAVLGAAELKAQWKAIGRDENTAWHELAARWRVEPGEGDACAGLARQQVRCYKFAATLPLLKSLDRPGFLSLRDEAGRTTKALLVGLRGDIATLLVEGRPQAVSLAALTKLWQGEFGTLWRMPPGYSTSLAEGATGPLVDRLATQLAGLAGEPAPPPRQTMDGALRAKVVRFQTANGLSAVGKAGPTTFMQLNRATGVDEPRLGAAVPEGEEARMSYILDALRRADAERERGAVPGLHTQQFGVLPGDEEAPRKSRLLIGTIVLLVIALGGVLSWQFFGGSEPAPRQIVQAQVTPAPSSSPAPALSPAFAPVPAAAVPSQALTPPVFAPPSPASATKTTTPARPPAPRPAVRREPATAKAPPTATATAPPPADKLYTQGDLPEAIRRELPKLSYGGGSYSGDKASRLAFLNGQVFHEGDTVAPGLVLKQVKQKGAILVYKGYRFELGT